jgi:uncharacterized protein YabN with tetrapyrrole methylase and pyrophosphatase domain
MVAEATAELVRRKCQAAGVECRVLPALSFLDAVFVALAVDPVRDGLLILDATVALADPQGFGRKLGAATVGATNATKVDGLGGAEPAAPVAASVAEEPAELSVAATPLAVPVLLAQVYDQFVAGEVKLALLEVLPPETPATIVSHAGMPAEERLIHCSLAELDHFQGFDHLTCVYLPKAEPSLAGLPLSEALPAAEHKRGRQPQSPAAAAPEQLPHQHEAILRPSGCRYPLDPLADVFDQLLGPKGCPWDIKQTHASLKPYLLEEAAEAAEAIDENDMAHLKEELGDVLLQIAFHSALAKQRGDFDLNDVIAVVTQKLIRRHPHVFGEAKANNEQDVAAIWSKVKEAERKKTAGKNS